MRENGIGGDEQNLYAAMRGMHAKMSQTTMAILQGNTITLVTAHSFTAPPEAVEAGMAEDLTVVHLTLVVEGPIENTHEFTNNVISLAKKMFKDAREFSDVDGHLTKVTEQ